MDSSTSRQFLKPALRQQGSATDATSPRKMLRGSASSLGSVRFADSALPATRIRGRESRWLENVNVNADRDDRGSDHGAGLTVGTPEKGFSKQGSGLVSSPGSENLERLRKSFSLLSDNKVVGSRETAFRLGTRVLTLVFSPIGILVCYRLLPLSFTALYVLASFCPGSTSGESFCGDAGFDGLFSQHPAFAMVSISILVLGFVYVAAQCSSHWVQVIQTIRTLRSSQKVSKVVSVLVDTEQPTETTKISLAPLYRPVAVAIYTVIWAPLLVVSELVLLLRYPLRLASDRFLSDYEIFRFSVLAVAPSVLGVVVGISLMTMNSVSPVGTCLFLISICMIGINLLFVRQFSADDGVGFIAGFVATGFIATTVQGPSETRSVKDEHFNLKLDETSGDCPFYKTMSYRSTVDFREEKMLKDFQIVQFLRNLRINPRLKSVWFAPTNALHAEIGKLVANQLKDAGRVLETVNALDIKKVMSGDALVQTPDTERCRILFTPALDSATVNSVDWRDGLPWKTQPRLAAQEHTLFPFTASMCLSLAPVDLLVEIDLGSNGLGDEVAKDLSVLIYKAKKIFNLEIAQNAFSKKGIKRIIDVIIDHPAVEFVRLSTVLLVLSELRKDTILDLSVPKTYAHAVLRCVNSLFDACAICPELTGTTMDDAPRLPTSAEGFYFLQIASLLPAEYRLCGRELYRSVPPEVASQCIRRVAHRLGKYQIDDPHEELDLPADGCLDAGVVRSASLVERRLYTTFLHEYDVMLIAKIVEVQNQDIEELDVKGQPLSMESFIALLKAVRKKPRLRSLNFSNCKISDPAVMEPLITFLIESPESLAEVNLMGNRAFNDKKEVIWSRLSASTRINIPRVLVDNNW